MKKWLIPIIITLIAISTYVYAQTKMTSAPIKPIEDDKMTVCWSYEISIKGDIDTKTECRRYPTDLKNRCHYGRYEVIRCEDILEDVINKDIGSWYDDLGREYTECKTDKDCSVGKVIIQSVTDSHVNGMVGKEYDFVTKEVV